MAEGERLAPPKGLSVVATSARDVMPKAPASMGGAAAGADAQLSLEEAFAFIDECDTEIFGALLPGGDGGGLASPTPGTAARTLSASASASVPPGAAALALALSASASTSASAPPGVPAKKKRVRRQKLELEYLRKQVVELEDKLAQLKRVTGSRRASGSSADEDEDEACDRAVEASSPVSAATTCEATSPGGAPGKQDADARCSVATLWMGVAERQYKERLRAEQQNQRLKAMLEAQIKLAGSLEKLLTKRPSEEAIEAVTATKRVKRSWELTAENDVAIFEQQLADVARAHLQVDAVFAAPEFGQVDATFHDTRVKSDPAAEGDGISYEFLSSATLPFNLKTASNAFWRMMAFESIKKHTYYQRDVEVTDNLVARTYGLDINMERFQARFCGKQTVRKYLEADRVVIVWRQLLEPSKVNGTKFHGLQCHETGWVVIRDVSTGSAAGGGGGDSGGDGESVPLTAVQAFAKMAPLLQDDIVDQELQIGALTDFVMGFHDLSVALSCQLMADLLVEEDWKTAQQFESLTL